MSESLTPSSWSTGGVALCEVGKTTWWKRPSREYQPSLSLAWSAVLACERKPTVTPRLFRPVTWVCTDPGKFSAVNWAALVWTV